MNGSERQATKSESRLQFSNWEKILLSLSSFMLGVTATLLPLLPRTAQAQEKPPVSSPSATEPPKADFLKAGGIPEIPNASFPPDIGLLRIASRELPPTFLNELRSLVREYVTQARENTTIFMVQNPESGKEQQSPLTEVSHEFLMHMSPEEEYAVQAVIEYFIATAMVKMNSGSETENISSLSPEEYEAYLMKQLEEQSKYWSQEFTVKMALFVMSALQEAETQASYVQRGESSPVPGATGTESLALLQAKAKLYPGRLLITYLVDLLDGKQQPLAEPGTPEAALYEEKIIALLVFMITRPNEDLLERVQSSRKIKDSDELLPFLSEEHLKAFTDGLHGWAGGSLFPVDTYNPEQVAKDALIVKWQLMELGKLNKQVDATAAHWQRIIRQLACMYLEKLN